jgi:hypothetical protein
MKNLFKWISNLFTKAYDFIEIKAPLAVIITQKVKLAIEEHNGSIEWILDQTATEKDNEAYEFIKQKLNIVIKEIAVIDGIVSDNLKPELATEAYLKYLANKSKESRIKDYIMLAARILQAIIGKKIPYDLLVLATQKAYRVLFGK